MKFIPGQLPGIIVVEPKMHRDARGVFIETYHKRKYSEGGISISFVQDNSSKSVRGTLRGLHAQIKHPQGKLVRVVNGEIFDVAVDIRRGSPYFSKWTGVTLSGENAKQMYVPEGFLHGFVVLSETAEVEYKCTDFYDPADEITVIWNDPAIGIKWPVESPTLSAKDRNGSTLSRLMERLPVYERLPL